MDPINLFLAFLVILMLFATAYFIFTVKTGKTLRDYLNNETPSS